MSIPVLDFLIWLTPIVSILAAMELVYRRWADRRHR